jgi:ABC-type glycerol-3-phosphate transport system permease component
MVCGSGQMHLAYDPASSDQVRTELTSFVFSQHMAHTMTVHKLQLGSVAPWAYALSKINCQGNRVIVVFFCFCSCRPARELS